jgi:hypothetical protein
MLAEHRQGITMLRKFLLPTLAIAALAGCATGYTYRGGSGDYYYGQPRVEYRYHGGYGAYGPYGGFGYGGGYYYDRFGRLVYRSPYGGYYGYPYGYGGWWYAPRPRPGHHGDGGHHDHDGQPGSDRDDRPPPWRGIDRGQPRPPRIGSELGDDARPRVRRQAAPPATPMPQQQGAPRTITPREPRVGSDRPGGSRMGRVIRSAKASGVDALE